MDQISLSRPKKTLKGRITLPTSKSISNRVLIIKELCNDEFNIKNLSDSDDTQKLSSILSDNRDGAANAFNVGAAGTTMRFLTAYFSLLHGERLLSGSPRMNKRPIKILVDCLRAMGASIKYLGEDGYPPIKITGTADLSDEISIDPSVSSQYISALLLISPSLERGLTVYFKGEFVSKSYVEMTLHLMSEFGIAHKQTPNSITILPQRYSTNYIPKESYPIEGDWSAASYWYLIALLSDSVDLTIDGLRQHSCQGDSKIANIFKWFGIKTEYYQDRIVLKKIKNAVKLYCFDKDFTDMPDMAQTVAVAMCSQKIPGTLTGLSTLKIKETDRILALANELRKFGAVVETGDDYLRIKKYKNATDNQIETYEDHRMAMAFAPLSSISPIVIHNPNVVTKSYPQFFEHLKQVGFKVL